jgi:hypothetical protein
MKAEITEFGELVLTPENGTEAFALHRWHEAFADTVSVVKRPTLSIGKLEKENYNQ